MPIEILMGFHCMMWAIKATKLIFALKKGKQKTKTNKQKLNRTNFITELAIKSLDHSAPYPVRNIARGPQPRQNVSSSIGVLLFFIAFTMSVIMGAIASQITSLTIVLLTVYLNTDQRKHQSSASLAFVQGIRRWPVNSPHKWPVTRKMFPFDDLIISFRSYQKPSCFQPSNAIVFW